MVPQPEWVLAACAGAFAPLTPQSPPRTQLFSGSDPRLVSERLLLFFESGDNLKRHLTDCAGFTASATQLREISSCLRQGRQLLRIARNAEMMSLPLVAYYAMASLAKALLLSFGDPKHLANLRPSHGLKVPGDMSGDLQDLKVQVEGENTLFQRFARTLLEASGFPVRLRNPAAPVWLSYPSVQTINFLSLSATLKELLSRVIGIEDIFLQTFQERPKVVQASYSAACWEGRLLQVSLSLQGEGLDETDYLLGLNPVLRRWRRREQGGTQVVLENLPPDLEPRPTTQDAQAAHLIPFHQMAVPLARKPDGSFALIGSLGEQSLPEAVIMYMAAFLLSSVSRYRQDIWATLDAPAAPGARLNAVLTAFYDEILVRFPLQIVAALARAPVAVWDGRLVMIT